MRLEAKRWPVGDREGWAILLLDDQLEELCSLAVPEDTVADWQAGWQILAQNETARVDRFLDGAQAMADTDPRTCSLTVIRVLYGLVKFLYTEPAGALSHRDRGLRAVHEFLDERFYFGRIPEAEPPEIQMFINGRIQRRLGANPTWTESWLAAFFKWRQAPGGMTPGQDQAPPAFDFVQYAIEYYRFLYHAARIQRDPLVLHSFVAFSRALAERLEREERYRPYRRRLLEIYPVIVRHEDDLNVAREGLRYLLERQAPPAEKWTGLTWLIHNLKRDHVETGGQASGGSERIATLTGLIADYYLDRYDLACTVAVWRQLGARDLLLRTILALMQRPGHILIFHGIAFLLLVLFARASTFAIGGQAGAQSLSTTLGALTLFLLLAGPVWLGLGTFYSLLKRRLYYAQLFLPRLLGATVAGLSVLMLDDLPWRIGMLIPGALVLAISIGVLLLSYLYLLFEVYETIKFNPSSERICTPPRAGNTRSARRPLLGTRFRGRRLGGAAPEAEAKSTLINAARIAFQIFAIGVVQSFLATTFASGLMLPVTGQALQGGQAGAPSLLAASSWGWIEIDLGVTSFIFVPTLILLWTSMAFFIGAFVQLLWQERHVTSPIRE